MKVRYVYSHLNGLEYLLIHNKKLWEEILEVIENVDADQHKKNSKDKVRKNSEVYDQKAINSALKKNFTDKGWSEHRKTYFFTPSEDIAREIMQLPSEDQKKIIEENGKTPFSGYNQTDFLKDGIAIEVQFGKYAFVAYDLFVKHMAFYISNDINVGIEILPTKAMQKRMDTGVSAYEKEVFNVYRSGRNTPAVPLVVIGIEPDGPDYSYESEDDTSVWSELSNKTN